MAIYDVIGEGYDTTRRADPEITSILANLLQADPGHRYLDLACGTGNYTTALAAVGGQWHAVDQSQRMLAEARAKSQSVAWYQMEAENIGFPSSSFDGALCTLAIHHFADIETAFRETARVLKPGARFVIFTAFPNQMKRYWLVEYFPEMMEKACKQMPDEKAVSDALTDAGLVSCELRPFDIRPKLEDFFLYSGKQRPDLYLSASVRSGISSFNNGFCSAAEQHRGLARLEEDINSGRIASVIAHYAHGDGDYAFVVAQKPV